MQELRRLRYFQVNVIICHLFHCFHVAIFFKIWVFLYLMTFLKILSESSVPSGPVCNVSILITYICTCTSIWFSIPDIHIHYENLFMIKKKTELFCISFTATMPSRLRLSWRTLWQRYYLLNYDDYYFTQICNRLIAERVWR